MKRKTIALFCAVVFACSGSVASFATPGNNQAPTEQSPREGRTVRDAKNRPTRTPRTEKKENGQTNDTRKVVPRK